jgi:hypothetical protein
MGMKDNILKHLSLALPNSRRRFRASIPVASAAICDLLEGNFASLPSAKVRATNFRSIPGGPYGRSQRGIVRLIVRLMRRLLAQITPRI